MQPPQPTLQRITGSYSHRNPSISQLDSQVKPETYQSFDGFHVPIGCGATYVKCDRGDALLYVSWTCEVPLYYTVHNGGIYWHEQQLALPKKGTIVEKGQAVLWNRIEGIRTKQIEIIPQPAIDEQASPESSIQEYSDLLVQAVQRRVETLPSGTKIAVSQSGGLDSCLVAWALAKLKIPFTPLVACNSLEDWDYTQAVEALAPLGITPEPLMVERSQMGELFDEAVFCCESAQADNLQMAVCNLMIARECDRRGITAIFNGHAHDDFMGSEGLVQAEFKKLTVGTESQRWRDARRNSISGYGMEKMFSSTFRRYGIRVKTPFFDQHLVNWILSRPTNIIPVKARKPFARAIARQLLPVGEWHRDVYNRHGYITGAGFYEEGIRPTVEHHLERAKQHLNLIKHRDWRINASLAREKVTA